MSSFLTIPTYITTALPRGNFTAGTTTATLNGNALTATSATNVNSHQPRLPLDPRLVLSRLFNFGA